MSYIVAVVEDGKTCIEIDGVYSSMNGLGELANYMLWKHDPDGDLEYKSYVLEIKTEFKIATAGEWE
tara:strand:- start:312 stop:512 length:201 start_codon:yes stop_codon:yes gene_type:complete